MSEREFKINDIVKIAELCEMQPDNYVPVKWKVIKPSAYGISGFLAGVQIENMATGEQTLIEASKLLHYKD